MTAKRANPGWRAGARDRLAGQLDGSEHTRSRRVLQESAKIDELLYRLTDRLRRGHFTGWEREFAFSIVGQARRSGWSPSAKQIAVIRNLVAQPATSAQPNEALIDEGDDDFAA